MNSSPNNENQVRSKVCGYCFKQLPNIAQFCPFCGFETNVSSSIFCPNCNKPIREETNFCQFCGTNTKTQTFTSPPFPTHYAQLYRDPKKPTLLKLPIFYIIFCLFGLELGLEFIVVLFYALISTSPEISTELTLIFSNIIRFLQVIIIYFIISRNINFRNFKPFRIDKNLGSEPKGIKNPVRYSLRTIFLTIPLIVSIVYLFNSIATLIIDFLKSIFNITNPYFSPYSEFDQTDTLIILFTVSVIFVAPILEELLFRGFLHYSFIKAGFSDWGQYFLQAILFAFLHLIPDIISNGSIDFIILHMLSTASLAIGATWLRKKYDSVTYSILLHAAWNSLSVIFSYFAELIPPEGDLVLIEVILAGSFISIILISIFFLKLTREWNPGIPEAFKNLRNADTNLTVKIVILSLSLAVLSNSIQFLPFLPFFSQISLDEFQIFFYMISVSVISGFFFIFWPNYVYDATIGEIKKDKEKSN